MCPSSGQKYMLKSIKPEWDPMITFKTSAKILNIITIILVLHDIFKIKDFFAGLNQLLFFIFQYIFQIFISNIFKKCEKQHSIQKSSFDISKEATISMLSLAQSFHAEKTESIASILILSYLGLIGTFITSFYIFFSFSSFSLPQIWWLILNIFLFIIVPLIRYWMEKHHQFLIYQWDECLPCNCSNEF